MSRSFKKHFGDSICSSYDDKWARTQYHRTYRRKSKNLLKQQEKFGTSIWQPVLETCSGYNDICNIDDWWVENPSEYIINYDETSRPNFCSDCFMCAWAYWNKEYDSSIEPYENIITNRIDYSVRFADSWCWGSDGGSYWQDDISSCRQEIDSIIFGIDRYSQTTIWDEYQKEVKKYNKEPEQKYWLVTLTYKDVYYSWDYINGYQPIENIYEKKIKIPYTKKGIIENLPNDGWIKLSGYRIKKYNARQPHSDWHLLDYLLYRNIMPKNFKSVKELISWYRSNQELIIRKWLTRRYSK